MRVTFVALGWEQLGISLLSALAKRDGHDVNLAFSVSLFNDRYNLSIPSIAPFFDDRGDVIESIRRHQPQAIVFSPLTGSYQWMLGIAREAKEILPNTKIIFGGVHTSAVPDRVLAQAQVDYVCVGEGDVAFPLILKAIENGTTTELIPNTRYKLSDGSIVRGVQNGFIQDLNSLPIYDKSLWENYINIGDWYLTMASRGCPYRCTFCFNNFFARLPEQKAGKYVRQRSVEHMMFELKQAKKRYRLRFVEFEDDVFTVDKKWVKEFLFQYKKEINVPFQCLTHPKYLDEDVASWLSDAGCRYIQMGIQSMDDKYKYETIRRYETKQEIVQAMEAMKKFKIEAKVDHMFGLPGEPVEAQESARELYVQYPPYRIQTFWTNFLPGTEMTHQALENGTISLEDMERLNDGLNFDFYRNSSRIHDPKLMKLYKTYEVFYKMLPILPRFLRERIHPRVFNHVPMVVCSGISFVTDVFAGLLKQNPDHKLYAKHNLFHLFRSLLGKLNIKVSAATCLNQDEPFRLNPPAAALEQPVQHV
jgi:radical SAM superfamily enzyme YgiQ (UPF0313 family)